MENLSEIEKLYLQELFEGKVDNVYKLRVIAKAVNEGRYELDLTDPKAKAWEEKYSNHLANLLVYILQGKKERNEPLTDEDIEILEDYEKNGILPSV